MSTFNGSQAVAVGENASVDHGGNIVGSVGVTKKLTSQSHACLHTRTALTHQCQAPDNDEGIASNDTLSR